MNLVILARLHLNRQHLSLIGLNDEINLAAPVVVVVAQLNTCRRKLLSDEVFVDRTEIHAFGTGKNIGGHFDGITRHKHPAIMRIQLEARRLFSARKHELRLRNVDRLKRSLRAYKPCEIVRKPLVARLLS